MAPRFKNILLFFSAGLLLTGDFPPIRRNAIESMAFTVWAEEGLFPEKQPPPWLQRVNENPIPQAAFPLDQVVCVRSKTVKGELEGSGFIVGPGYILTSGHQAHPSDRISVYFYNGKRFPALVVSVSDPLDLSLLKITKMGSQEAKPLPLNVSNGLNVGMPVIAIGCPFGLSHSVSQGIISAPERIVRGRPVLQTDVAINPGNSGGPLLNKQGEVIGVVLGTLSDARGISFALPSREVKRFLGETFLQMGTLLANEKKYSEAAPLLMESIRYRPQSAEAYNNLGQIFFHLNKRDKAEQAYTKALEIDPQYADAHFNMGTFYDKVLKNPHKAERYYKRYLELEPTSPNAGDIVRWLKDRGKNK